MSRSAAFLSWTSNPLIGPVNSVWSWYDSACGVPRSFGLLSMMSSGTRSRTSTNVYRTLSAAIPPTSPSRWALTRLNRSGVPASSVSSSAPRVNPLDRLILAMASPFGGTLGILTVPSSRSAPFTQVRIRTLFFSLFE